MADRFDPESVADRLDKAREAAKLPVKAIAADIWPEQGENARFSWYKKVAQRGSSFELWEISRACDLIEAAGYHLPPGFPFVDRDYGLIVERLNRKR